MKMDKEKIMKEIFGEDLYAWDNSTIMSAEFIDHVDKVLDNNL